MDLIEQPALNKDFVNILSEIKGSSVITALKKFKSKYMFNIKPIYNGKKYSYKKQNLMGIAKGSFDISFAKLCSKVGKFTEAQIIKANDLIINKIISSSITLVETKDIDLMYSNKSVQSCMTKDIRKHQLEFYKENNIGGALLMIGNKIVSRTILRTDVNGQIWYDRIYSLLAINGLSMQKNRWNNKIDVIMAKKLESLGYKCLYRLSSNHKIDIKDKVVEIPIKQMSECPYFDSISTVSPDKNMISNYYSYNSFISLNENVRCYKCNERMYQKNIYIKDGKCLGCRNCNDDYKFSNALDKMINGYGN